jgi:hypothetical protein
MKVTYHNFKDSLGEFVDSMDEPVIVIVDTVGGGSLIGASDDMGESDIFDRIFFIYKEMMSRKVKHSWEREDTTEMQQAAE